MRLTALLFVPPRRAPYLNVEPLPFGRISTEDRELVQLKTVLESSPHVGMPPYSHLAVYSSPRVTLVHLAANTIPLGLRITGQEVPQLLVRLDDCLIILLLGFLEYLLHLLDFQLAGLHIIIQQDNVLGPSSLQVNLEHPGQLHNSLSMLPALYIQPLLLDNAEARNNMCKVFLGVPMGVDGHVEDGTI